MIRYVKKYGVMNFSYLYISVRVFKISLGTFLSLCRDLKINFPMDLARTFFRSDHSYEEIKSAVLEIDSSFKKEDRNEFENTMISELKNDGSTVIKNE